MARRKGQISARLARQSGGSAIARDAARAALRAAAASRRVRAGGRRRRGRAADPGGGAGGRSSPSSRGGTSAGRSARDGFDVKREFFQVILDKSVRPINGGWQFLTRVQPAWWNSHGTKADVERCFDLKREFFQVILDKSVRPINGGHVAAADALYNPQTESFSHVSTPRHAVSSRCSCKNRCRATRRRRRSSAAPCTSPQADRRPPAPPRRPALMTLDRGRVTTLMQANLLTQKWLEFARRPPRPHQARAGRSSTSSMNGARR